MLVMYIIMRKLGFPVKVFRRMKIFLTNFIEKHSITYNVKKMCLVVKKSAPKSQQWVLRGRSEKNTSRRFSFSIYISKYLYIYVPAYLYIYLRVYLCDATKRIFSSIHLPPRQWSSQHYCNQHTPSIISCVQD